MDTIVLIICLVIACIVMIAQHLIIRKTHQDHEGLQDTLIKIKNEVDEYGKIENEYNKLVNTYNKLLEEYLQATSEHDKVIKTYNNLVKDFNKAKGYNMYLADINEYLLGLQTFNTISAHKFETFCQEAAEKYGVENIIKKEGKENE